MSGTAYRVSVQPQGSSKTRVGASRFSRSAKEAELLEQGHQAFQPGLGEALTSPGPPWAAAYTRAEGVLPSPPRSGPRTLPRPKVTSPNLPRFPSAPYRVSRTSQVPRAQPCWGERSRRKLHPAKRTRIPRGSRGVARERTRRADYSPWEGEATPPVAPPTVDHVIAASLGRSFQLLPLAHVMPLGHIGWEVGSPTLLRRSRLTLTCGNSL